MQTMTNSFGVDVSSKWLDIAHSDEFTVRRIDNTVSAIQDWLKELPQCSVIAMEVSGRYHRLIATLAYEAGHQVFVLNPGQVAYYAKGIGRRAKSDAIDAAIILRYVQNEKNWLHPWVPPTETQQLVTSRLQRRALVIKQRQALTMAFKYGDISDTTVDNAINALTQLADTLEQQVIHLLEKDEAMSQLLNIFTTLPGVGPLTAAYMTNILSHQKFTHADALVSYVGLDLRFCDSGLKKGRRRLSKSGSSEARRLLFNCARAASMGALKPLYEHFRARMNHTQATVAIMRKLVKLIYGVWKSNKPFELALFSSPNMKIS